MFRMEDKMTSFMNMAIMTTKKRNYNLQKKKEIMMKIGKTKIKMMPNKLKKKSQKSKKKLSKNIHIKMKISL